MPGEVNGKVSWEARSRGANSTSRYIETISSFKNSRLVGASARMDAYFRAEFVARGSWRALDSTLLPEAVT